MSGYVGEYYRDLIRSIIILIMIIITTILYNVAGSRENFLSPEYINRINGQNLSWKAGINFDEGVSFENVANLVGNDDVKRSNKKYRQFLGYEPDDVPMIEQISAVEFPTSFDARKRWPHCKTIRYVYDQGNCRSAWAIAPMSTFADRLCIETDGKFNQPLSAGYVLSCCYLCGRGCHGGWDDSAWHFAQKYGVPTGGHYASEKGCYPYPIAPCDHSKTNKTSTGCLKFESLTPICQNGCPNYNYPNKRENDLQKVARVHYMRPREIERSKLQLMISGPLEAFFEVYSDFFNYKKGVYQVSANAEFVGYHAVKIIGWGIERDRPYWLVVNSWGKRWGDKGLFKIRILENGVNFEDKFITGFPLIK